MVLEPCRRVTSATIGLPITRVLVPSGTLAILAWSIETLMNGSATAPATPNPASMATASAPQATKRLDAFARRINADMALSPAGRAALRISSRNGEGMLNRGMANGNHIRHSPLRHALYCAGLRFPPKREAFSEGEPLNSRFAEAMAKLPLAAILRGIRPDEATPILMALIDAGFHIIETPLNSPQPFETIRLMRLVAPKDALIGAGTVRKIGRASCRE